MLKDAMVAQIDDVIALKDEEIERLKQELASQAGSCQELPIRKIVPLQLKLNEQGETIIVRQPRAHFDLEKLADLKRSIEINGLHEPIIVRLMPDGGYGIIDGERRWRCHIELGKQSILGIVHGTLSDDEALERSLTSHCLREQVSPLEQTISIVNLMRLRLNMNAIEVRRFLHSLNNSLHGKTNVQTDSENTAAVIGILNSLGLQLGSLIARLPLLDLSVSLRQAVEDGVLSPTNAMLIARAPEQLHQQLLDEGKSLSKRELQKLITCLKEKKIEASKEQTPIAISEVATQIKTISKSPFIKNGGDQRVNRKLQKISKLLSEVQEYLKQKSS
ncbi:ParB/RepB/Spo0J family partition protein [Sphaerothrix gracilis]|uniref:ParB/RepB/Spo0J family partition protein n=1 Tax=Sphaerothrix gracilis TaxID=3151835 RepID=UPI0031FCD2BC